jgi:fumarylacetoacetate (FAA) hydrolase
VKRATLRNGTREDALAVVARDLTKTVLASEAIAGATWQQLLNDWVRYVLKLEQVSAELNKAADGARFHAFTVADFTVERCMAPLSRAYQWADGSAYLNHVELALRRQNAWKLLDRSPDVSRRIRRFPWPNRADFSGR